MPPVELLGLVAILSFAVGPTVMLNAALVPPVSPVADAVSVYPLPALLIERPLKVATPLTALSVAVPLSVPLLGFVPIAPVIDAVLVVTVLPPASCTVTTGCVGNVMPPVELLGF